MGSIINAIYLYILNLDFIALVFQGYPQAPVQFFIHSRDTIPGKEIQVKTILRYGFMRPVWRQYMVK